MDVRFHCSHRVRRSGRKSRHHLFDACPDVCKVLSLHPEYGVPVSGHGQLRKMRVRVPSLNVGKSGGYRLIYRQSRIDECIHVVFLEAYLKGDKEDLAKAEYVALLKESEAILGSPIDYEWTVG